MNKTVTHSLTLWKLTGMDLLTFLKTFSNAARDASNRQIFLLQKNCRSIEKSYRLFIPNGRIPTVRLNFSTEIAKLTGDRDVIRIRNPGDPKITDLNDTIRNRVNVHKKNKWNDYLRDATFIQGQRNLWKRLKSLTKPLINNPEQNYHDKVAIINTGKCN